MMDLDRLRRAFEQAERELPARQPDLQATLMAGRRALYRRLAVAAGVAVALFAALLLGGLAARAALTEDEEPRSRATPRATTTEGERERTETAAPTPGGPARTAPAGSADLVADDAAVADQAGMAQIQIRNVGGRDAGPFAVRLNGRAVTVRGLAAGDRTAVRCPGGRTLVEVDPDGAVEEGDEDNNSKQVDCPLAEEPDEGEGGTPAPVP